ncbi:MAG: hypothetical protein WC314_19250 [Vulcanimicrobiota bacterium]
MAGESEKDPKLERMGTKLIETLPGGVRAFLFLQIADNLQELWRSGGLDKGTGGDGKRVLGICCKRQRSVLIHHAEKDTQMRGIKFRSFQSALCVPIFAHDKSLLGTILLIADEPESFTNEHKFSVERTARDYSAPLEAKRKVHEAPIKSGEADAPGPLLLSPAVIGSVALAVMLLGIWLFSPPNKDTHEPTQAAPIESPVIQARETAEQFLASLREERFEQAWMMLAPNLRSRWHDSDFTRTLQDWLAAADHQQVLAKRDIAKVQRQTTSAQVVFFESSVPGDGGHWVWDLAETDGEWKVTAIKGPVNSP